MTRPQRSWLRRLAGAVLLGVGSIFQARHDEHWSRPPVVAADHAAPADASGGPPT